MKGHGQDSCHFSSYLSSLFGSLMHLNTYRRHQIRWEESPDLQCCNLKIYPLNRQVAIVQGVGRRQNLLHLVLQPVTRQRNMGAKWAAPEGLEKST